MQVDTEINNSGWQAFILEYNPLRNIPHKKIDNYFGNVADKHVIYSFFFFFNPRKLSIELSKLSTEIRES